MSYIQPEVEECRYPLAEIGMEPLRRVLSQWEAVRAQRVMPEIGDLGVGDLDYLSGRFNLIEVRHDPLSFRFTLHGRLLAAVDPRDFSNRELDEIEPAEHREMLRRHYEEAVSLGHPTLYRIIRRSPKTHFYWQMILPMMAPAQRRVGQLLAVSMYPAGFTAGFDQHAVRA